MILPRTIPFRKTKRGLELILLPDFLQKFWRKILVIFYQLTKFDCLVAITSWDIRQYVYFNCLLTRLWRHKFWNWYFQSSHFFYMTKKSRQKFKYIENEKSFYDETKCIFISVKELLLKQIKQIFFRKWESDFKIMFPGLNMKLCWYFYVLHAHFSFCKHNVYHGQPPYAYMKLLISTIFLG